MNWREHGVLLLWHLLEQPDKPYLDNRPVIPSRGNDQVRVRALVVPTGDRGRSGEIVGDRGR